MNDYHERGRIDGPCNLLPTPQLPAETVALALALAPRHGLVIWRRSAWVKCHRQAGSGVSAAVLDRRRRRRGRRAMYTTEEGGEP